MSTIDSLGSISVGTSIPAVNLPVTRQTAEPVPVPTDQATPTQGQTQGQSQGQSGHCHRADKDRFERTHHDNRDNKHKVTKEELAERFAGRAQRYEDRAAQLREAAEKLAESDPDRAARIEHRADRLDSKAEKWWARAEKFGFARRDPTPLPAERVGGDPQPVETQTVDTAPIRDPQPMPADQVVSGTTQAGLGSASSGTSLDVTA